MDNHNLNLKYNHREIEKKWQDYWLKSKIFVTELEDFSKPKKYILPMFPYPSGNGLHVGHVRNYVIVDVAARFYRMNGFNVLTAIGWDAFGLPSEQYAIKTNNHPSLFNAVNIEIFKSQLKSLGFSYDWSKEINTTDPDYYRWTQWIFKQIYLEKLANYTKIPVFWCEELRTVLSHEEVKNIDGKLFSERGLFPVIRREIPQWTLQITRYARKLSDDLKNLDWPLSIKKLQKNWIGVSEGVVIEFKLFSEKKMSIDVFTTRADTILSVNAVAISPSHKMLEELVGPELSEKVSEFCQEWKDNDNGLSKIGQVLKGEFTGAYCLNPVNDEKIPIFVTNFVFDHYGTGALMISPFSKKVIDDKEHDLFLSKKEREQNYQIDHRFSLQFQLPIKDSISFGKNEEINYKEGNILADSKSREEAIKKVTDYLVAKKSGYISETYHLRDWVFSRQRYWGEPIPILHFEDGSTRVLNDLELPLRLPELSNFSPSAKYYSPLQKLPEWVNLISNNLPVRRDVNVMPQWAGSCWYYIAFLLRAENGYLDLNSSKAKEIINHWLPVDLYVGGQEHANLHLLYARFWHKVLQKIGVLKSYEPFQKLLCQGMILGENGEKMSKSKGNIISPNECIEKWGSDALRLYESFLAPVEQTSNFSPHGVGAMKKWLNRVYVLFVENSNKFVKNCEPDGKLKIGFHKLTKEVTDDYQQLKLNLVVAKLMEFINLCYLTPTIPVHYGKAFIQMLNPLAPHIAEELWSRFSDESLSFSSWPVSDENENVEENRKIVIQINGKKKVILEISRIDIQKSKILDIAMQNHIVASSLLGKKIIKTIEIKNKLINIVTNESKS